MTDSQNGRVILLDERLRVEKIFDFKDLPKPLHDDLGHEWIQHTYPINDHLLATVDSRRSQVYVWDPDRRIYSHYGFDPRLEIQSIQPKPAYPP